MKLASKLAVISIATLAFSAVLLQPSKQAMAVSISGWQAGNIMSDAVMGSKDAMTKSQIQTFLNSKNECNKSVASAGGSVIGESSTQAYWKSNKSIKYQITGGKKGTTQGEFLCMAKAKFDGKTAANVIYKASQDYSINPQVLLVLLQKESSLITDEWPNSNNYRTAMGYACPDSGPNNTANCDSSSYGFTNQVRQAAKLFRTVLDGGWTNYPVGDNYVQYNPDEGCGGKEIDIKNRATSALYRYTPYQPNPETLKRQWPITSPYPSCGAYGNLNFYMLFNQWFENPVIDYSKDSVITGDWNDTGVTNVGIKRKAIYYLDNNNDGSYESKFSWGKTTDKVMIGNWRGGNDIHSTGLKRGNRYFLDFNNDGKEDKTFTWGRSSDQSFVGKWDGRDSTGLKRGNRYFLDFNNDGKEDKTFTWGRASDTVIIGDWDGDGKDELGLKRGNRYFLDFNNDAHADVKFSWGRATDELLIGDWDGDNKESTGLKRGNRYFLDFNNDGKEDKTFTWGRSSDHTIVGKWNGNNASISIKRKNLYFFDYDNDGQENSNFRYLY